MLTGGDLSAPAARANPSPPFRAAVPSQIRNSLFQGPEQARLILFTLLLLMLVAVSKKTRRASLEVNHGRYVNFNSVLFTYVMNQYCLQSVFQACSE